MIKSFLFHRVSEVYDPLWEPMNPKHFEKIVNFLNKKYTVLSIEEINLLKEKKSKFNFASITFDDGYKDNIDIAAEILNKFKCKASFYVATECIEKNIPTWTYVFDYLFLNTQINKLDLDFDFISEEYKILKFKTRDEYIQIAKPLKLYLKRISNSKRVEIYEQILAQFNDVEIPKLMMDWDDLKVLLSENHVIGSHSHSHPLLGQIEEENLLRYELQHSYDLIHEKLGINSLTISYPIGSYNDKTIELSKEIGYKYGLTVVPKNFNPNSDDLFEIPRISMCNESWFKTRNRINNNIELLKKIVKFK